MNDPTEYTKEDVDAVLQDGEMPTLVNHKDLLCDTKFIEKMEEVLNAGYEVTPRVAENFIRFIEINWCALYPIGNRLMMNNMDFLNHLRKILKSMPPGWRARYETQLQQMSTLIHYMEERKTLSFLKDK